MKSGLLRIIDKLNKDRKHRKWWQRTVRTAGIVVVFCTTYALILPAITMEQETICGVEAHAHSESCYVQEPVLAFECGLDSEIKVVHTHDTICYDDQGTLICTLPELPAHAHTDDCYTRSETPACAYVHVHNEECTGTELVLVCGQEQTNGHSHSAACSTQQTLICQLQESEGHAHSDSCGSSEQQQICGTEEGPEHTHSDSCYEMVQIPCQIPETAAHAHGDACYEVREIVCELEEQVSHAHAESCYAAQETTCELTVNDGHVHEEACYSKSLTCELEEIHLHTHGDECYAADAEGGKTLICGVPAVIAHAHTEDCLVQTEQMRDKLICELEAHVHEDSCYPEEEESAYTYICGNGVHEHVETCYDAAGQLTCTIPEHIHDASCIVEDLDLTADVETQQQWEQTLDEIILTGNWPKDVLAVAESQLDYTQSVKNVVLEEGKLKGYTRYGQWYGDPYGDWDAMYAAFCLHYAGVEEYPVESDVDSWIEALTEAEHYFTFDSYTGRPGDLIFFDYDQKRDAIEEIPVDADHVGIVVELLPASEEEPARIKTIEGNVNGKVDYVTYALDDPAIIGYGKMPFGEIFQLNHAGSDYAVTVTVGKDALIPDTAQLTVREIEQGTEDYDSYYRQSVEAMLSQNDTGALTEEDLNVSFARFFDISILVDGVKVEPAAPVDIQIRYSESIAVKEEENGLVVHFAQDGVEVLDADTYAAEPEQQAEDNALTEILELFTGETEQVDTFQFTQSSFSVAGTFVTYAARAAGDTYYYKEPQGLDANGTTQYLIYTKADNGKYYAIYSETGNSADTAKPKEITFNADGSINMNLGWGESANKMLWTLTTDGKGYIIKNVGSEKYLHCFDNDTGESLTTNNGYATFMLYTPGDGKQGFLIKSNNDFAQINSNATDFTVGQSADVGSTFFLAAPSTSPNTYHVWFDGTNGGLMNLLGSDNTYQAVPANGNQITLPSTWKSPTKYPYRLNGWYDIVTGKHYEPGEKVTINQHTVFYADWNAADYNVGRKTEHVVESLDTSDFITTYVFDYNTLFNVQSVAHTGSISASGHTENWNFLEKGVEVPYNPDDGEQEDSIGFMFVDYDDDGDFSYAWSRNNDNVNRKEITDNIVDSNSDQAGGLLDLLFEPNTDVIGKHYVGTGNYLFQYMDSTTPNYDGEHDGYYYLDARLNAASYSTDEQGRFYLYNYLERTSDSAKDGGGGQYSDILPFNSPYIFGESDTYNGENNGGKRVDYYEDSIRHPGWEYDAKDGVNSYTNYNTASDAITNYFFGLRTDIEFFLPNNVGEKDDYDNYGNISTRGEHMVFDFHGDDDVWVFVDGQLMLDIGGLHGIMHGRIDFSTGKIITGVDGGDEKETDFELSEGTHTMTVYYMERGSSQSNCAIYFNIAPRYDLEITKEDIFTKELLNGAEFTIYTCEDCAYGGCTGTHIAQVWASQEAHEADMNDGVVNNAIRVMETVNGKASCWGLAAGKTYYIRETEPPREYTPGYPRTDDVIRVTLNNRGTATIETTTLHGKDEQITEGYAVIEQSVNNTLKIVSLTVTNQRDEETTQIRVKKVWDPNATDLPNSITAYLTVDGKQVGRPAVLTDANGWTYTWTGLPLNEVASDGTTKEIRYEVEEVQVSGFSSDVKMNLIENAEVEWVKTDAMEDSATYLLLNGGRALAYNGGFSWMTQEAAKADLSAQWSVTTNEYGFRLTNGNGYILTYNRGGSNGYFTATTETTSNGTKLNQVIYYLDGRLVAHDNDRYFQLSTNGSSVSADGLVFSLIRKDLVQGWVASIVNTLIPNEDHTFVEVNKVWNDFKDHKNDAVTMHLYADGVDTGRQAVLNEANHWHAVFDGLPYKDKDGKIIVYTIVEEEPDNYDAAYENKALDGKQIVTWVKQSRLTASNEPYRIVSGANALAIDQTGALTVEVNDPNSANQWWTAVSSDGRMILKHSQKNSYLTVSDGTVTTTTNANYASGITLNGEILSLRSDNIDYYLQMTKTAVTVSQSAYNATHFTVALRTEGKGNEGTGITVTNSEVIGYELPKTGGMGTSLFTFGGLLFMTAALMYISKFGRKQQRGGASSQ